MSAPCLLWTLDLEHVDTQSRYDVYVLFVFKFNIFVALFNLTLICRLFFKQGHQHFLFSCRYTQQPSRSSTFVDRQLMVLIFSCKYVWLVGVVLMQVYRVCTFFSVEAVSPSAHGCSIPPDWCLQSSLVSPSQDCSSLSSVLPTPLVLCLRLS